jgi:hypothetical protein
MRCDNRPALLGILLLSAIGTGCRSDGGSTGSSPPPLNAAGVWNEVEEITDPGNAFTCADTATVTLTQAGATITGNVVQTGTCQTPGGPIDNGGTLNLSGGVSGSTIAFNEPGSGGITCTYRGTLYHTPPDSSAGTVDCSGAGVSAAGTWRMTR